jgi:hypothetical protein
LGGADIVQSIESHVLAQRAKRCWGRLKRVNVRIGVGRSKSDRPHANVCTNVKKYGMTTCTPLYHLSFSRARHKPLSSTKLSEIRRGESRAKLIIDKRWTPDRISNSPACVLDPDGRVPGNSDGVVQKLHRFTLSRSQASPLLQPSDGSVKDGPG